MSEEGSAGSSSPPRRPGEGSEPGARNRVQQVLRRVPVQGAERADEAGRKRRFFGLVESLGRTLFGQEWESHFWRVLDVLEGAGGCF